MGPCWDRAARCCATARATSPWYPYAAWRRATGPMPGLEVTHAYHLVPAGVSKANAVNAHMRARGFKPEECIAVGDSVEDLEVAMAVGRFFVVANGPLRDQGLREALGRYDNVTVTEAAMGEGVYEAVVGTLMQR